MKRYLVLGLLLAGGLIFGGVSLASAFESDDEGGRRPLNLSTTFRSTFQDPQFGVCRGEKDLQVTFCGNNGGAPGDDDDGAGSGGATLEHDDDGLNNNDDDDGGGVKNGCRVCGNTQGHHT